MYSKSSNNPQNMFKSLAKSTGFAERARTFENFAQHLKIKANLFGKTLVLAISLVKIEFFRASLSRSVVLAGSSVLAFK